MLTAKSKIRTGMALIGVWRTTNCHILIANGFDLFCLVLISKGIKLAEDLVQ
jgi:hypothetical protein